MKVINLSEPPSLLNQYLKELRSITIQKDSMRFRKNIERIGQIMAFEVSKELTYAPEEVTTPLAVAKMEIIQDPIVLGTILRAGLPLHQGFLDMFDHAENAFVSAYRKEMENEENEEMDLKSSLNQIENYKGQNYMTAILKKCIISPIPICTKL